jgi:hypothetical protein
MPNQYYAWREVYDKSIAFIKRAGTVIFLCSLAIWILTRYNWVWQYVGPTDINDLTTAHIEDSMLAGVGKVLAWIFIPAWGGNYSWGATVSVIQGLIAKEQVVSSLSVISGEPISGIVSSTSPFYFFATNSWAAYSFIAFNLFSAPCFGALAAMKKELGSGKSMLKALLIEGIWSFSLSTLIGLVGWANNGWASVNVDMSNDGYGTYLGANGIDALVLVVVILLVALVIFFHWIYPAMQGRKASCAACEVSGKKKASRLLKDYHREQEKEAKKEHCDCGKH